MREESREMEDKRKPESDGRKVHRMICVDERRTDLIFLGLVRGGHVSQILDDLLGVLCLSGTRLSSVRDTNGKLNQPQHREKVNSQNLKNT